MEELSKGVEEMSIAEEDNQEAKQDMNGSAKYRESEKKKKTMQKDDTAHREARIFENLILDSGFATACTRLWNDDLILV